MENGATEVNNNVDVNNDDADCAMKNVEVMVEEAIIDQKQEYAKTVALDGGTDHSSGWGLYGSNCLKFPVLSIIHYLSPVVYYDNGG